MEEFINQSTSITLPPGFEEDKSYPLIIALHWGLDNYPGVNRDFMAGFIEPAFDGLGAILAAPMRRELDWTDASNEAVIMEVIAELQRTYPINTGQILLTGYSMGGIGSWAVGSRHQDTFTGILPISAQPPAGVLEFDWQVPLYVIHSQQDEYFPFRDVQTIVDELKQQGADISWHPLTNGTHFDTGSFISAVQASHPWIRSMWQ